MKQALVGLIKFYKRIISPFMPSCCRFTPSCSSYFAEAIVVYGIFKGSLLGFKRIAKCHPFSKGGFDPVK